MTTSIPPFSKHSCNDSSECSFEYDGIWKILGTKIEQKFKNANVPVFLGKKYIVLIND
jgi:hypothetical protein